jgi:hypothetical protein
MWLYQMEAESPNSRRCAFLWIPRGLNPKWGLLAVNVASKRGIRLIMYSGVPFERLPNSTNVDDEFANDLGVCPDVYAVTFGRVSLIDEWRRRPPLIERLPHCRSLTLSVIDDQKPPLFEFNEELHIKRCSTKLRLHGAAAPESWLHFFSASIHTI